MNPSDLKSSNPLALLGVHGQSVWLDYIRRSLLTGGELARLIDEDDLRGVTSNPAIFEKAITGGNEYAALLDAPGMAGADAKTRYERLAIADIREAADILQPVYARTRHRDGYVSLEVSPYLARDTAGTLEEARRLWSAVGRPNVMIKVPATPEGIPAIRALIAEGVNVNVTLLFSQSAYEAVAEAYLAGLEALVARGGDPSRVASVASFFISRIDTAIDALIAERLAGGDAQAGLLQSIAGRVAIANAKLTYHRFNELFGGPRWAALAARGAQKQRVLWASTGTKNPQFRDTIYVEELIGPDTVNTIPPATFDAFRDHGRPRASLTEDLEGAQHTIDTLAAVGIPLAEVTARLLDDGLALFAQAFDRLLNAVDRRCKQPDANAVNPMRHALPAPLAKAVERSVASWANAGKVRRLWARDAAIWSKADEANWLGWLDIGERQLARVEELEKFAAEVRTAGFSHVLLLGMGGSSLAPEVFAATFGRAALAPVLHVLDSTDPAQVKAFEAKVPLASTLFIVSSKSGSTLEPNIFKQYFYDRVSREVGAAQAGKRFVAITDPGSKMQQVATADGFRRIFFGLPTIGGRYSALSDFGMVPAAVAGIDVRKLLDRTEQMVQACSSCVAAPDNPGVVLGTILGTAALAGRDKLTIVASPALAGFGAWLEQLVAESTGKRGKGIVPVDRERPGDPAAYGADRVFAYLRLAGDSAVSEDRAVEALERAGHPVLRITLADRYDLGQELFRWEIATAVAGAILGINPFDQPDVEASKIATRKLTTRYEETGTLPQETPILEVARVRLYTDERNAQALAATAGEDRTLAGYLRAHFGRLGAGDYLALLGYVEMNAGNEAVLQSIRHRVRNAKRVATCLGFGPRFLHSTGQAYKGGPNSAVVLQITCDDAIDVPVPGQRYTFGVVKAAQARGDFEVLAERARRALRVHLGADVAAGLAALDAAVARALA